MLFTNSIADAVSIYTHHKLMNGSDDSQLL